MALHDSLRELVTVRGAGVVGEAEELRGALDDFLAEDEATLGELNLLVDAVRLGALRRVLDVMDHGAAADAAIREAGAALARDRGTDDPTRSCWALASLCFALGRVEEPMVRQFLGDTGTLSTPPTPPPPVIAPGHGTADRPGTQVLRNESSVPPPPPAAPASVPPPPVPRSVPPEPDPTVAVQVTPPPAYGAPPPSAAPKEKSSRAGVFLLVVLVALILGGLVAAGIILLGADDDDPTAGDDVSDSGSVSEGPRKAKPLPDSEMLVPYVVDDVSRVYRVDVETGKSRPVTPDGVDARLPTISPDRRTLTYQVGQSPSVVMLVDLATNEGRALFGDDSPCARASRPAWSPDGSQVAVLCDPDGNDDNDGIWVANADGSGVEGPIVANPDVKGSPTWISDTELIYGVEDPTVGSTFWRTTTEGGDGEQLLLDVPGHLSHIDWSAEADRLLLLASPGEEEGAIWTVDVDGQNPQPVVDGTFSHPVWSADGTAIGATVLDGGTEVLATVTLEDDGTGTVLDVPDPPPGEVGIPVWGSR